MASAQSLFVLKEVGRNLDDDHSVLFILFLIDIFKELNPEYFVDNCKGRKRVYELEELLGLNTWGDWNNRCSCRAKAQMCRNDDGSVQTLIHGKPSKSKINDFINEHGELIKAFDDFIVEFGRISGLVGGEEFTGDGTFLNGYADDFKALYPDEIRYVKNFLTSNKNEEYKLLYNHYYLDEDYCDEFNQLKKELKDNINFWGIVLILKALKSDTEYKKVMAKLKHMSENITKETVKVSITDSDAHNMKDKDENWGFHYNIQEIIDTKVGFVVEHYITKNPNDKKEIYKIVSLLINKFGYDFFKLALDHGYWNIPLIIKIMQETEVTLVIPDKENATKTKDEIIKANKSNKRYEQYVTNKKKNKKHRTFIERYEFPYIDEEDAFECPVMHYLLKFQRIVEDENNIEYREYWTNKCKKCPNLEKCTSQNKRIIKVINEPEIIKVKEIYNSEMGQKMYSKRGSWSEGCFGILLEARNFRGIKVRGIKKLK